MIGKTLSHYKVLEKIGQGGMGEVYRAEDTNLSREVAIKVLPEQFTQDPQRLARFEREAKLLAQLNHPNIAAIYGFEKADGVHFLALELVPGETLQERIAKGPLPVEEALEVCRQIAEGVEAAHEKGVIHRDLKPANVKVTPEGKVKILDFGLAKAFEAETPVTDISQSPTLTEEMTRAGVILGTAAYMSPEQAKGKPVDKRADVFAFGAVLYELLTGKRAFEGETITETIAKVLESEPDWELLPENTPWTIRNLLRRCLAKDAHDRFQHIGDVRIEVKLALSEPATASPIGVRSGTQSAGWQRAIPWNIVGVIALVAIVTVWILMRPTPQPVTKLVITPPATAPMNDSGGIDVAISPDGRNVVYPAVNEGTVQLYLHPLDQFTPTPISGTEGATSPFFSPDGKSVAFFSSDELRKVSLQGGPPVTIAKTPFLGIGSWSSEDIIVFGSRGAGFGLYRVPAGGGEPESLAVPDFDKGESGYRFPEILPSGEAVLFTILGRDGWQIAVLSLESGDQKILLEGGRQARYANTGHLVYEVAGSGALMAVPFDPERLEVTGDPAPLLQGVRYNPSLAVDYAFSSSGTLVYVPLQTNGQSLVWVDREGTERVITQEQRTFATPRISPDGRQLSVTIYDDDGRGDVWIYSFEQDSFSRLTFGGDLNATQSWSPDGKWIAFQSSGESQRGVYRQLADGSGPPQQLTTPTPVAQHADSWSPDGRVLALFKGGNIWVLPMDGEGEPQPLINSPDGFDCCSQFSPDGKWLAYVSNEGGQQNVYVSPYPKPDVKYLVSDEEGGAQPVWSPDGRELFYRSGSKMMVAAVQTEPSFSVVKPKLLFEGSYVFSQFSPGKQYYDISLDGQQFVMIKEAGQAQINVVLNWFEELKRLVPTP